MNGVNNFTTDIFMLINQFTYYYILCLWFHYPHFSHKVVSLHIVVVLFVGLFYCVTCGNGGGLLCVCACVCVCTW